MEWENGRELSRITRGSKIWDFTYDMAGVRSGKTVTTIDTSTGEITGTTEYKYTTLSGKLVRVEYNTTILDIVYDESGQPFSIRYKSSPTATGALYYYVLNAQGDVVGLLNASGELVVEYKYDPWGKLLETIIGVDETDSKYAAYNNMGLRNPLRYRGYIYDRDTGLYYLQSRYYDPEVGRFINADEFVTTDVTSLLGGNMFAYCENNPVNRSDINGCFAISTALALTLGMFGAAAMVCLMPDTQRAVADAGRALADVYESFKYSVRQQAKEIRDKYSKSYTVYFLQDDNGIVQYVGRVKTENYASRMQYHFKTKGLTPKYIVSGLNYMQARGLEEIGMVACHTINKGSYYNNQIHGISIFNVKRPGYLGAAEDYLANKAENALLNLLDR